MRRRELPLVCMPTTTVVPRQVKMSDSRTIPPYAVTEGSTPRLPIEEDRAVASTTRPQPSCASSRPRDADCRSADGAGSRIAPSGGRSGSRCTRGGPDCGTPAHPAAFRVTGDIADMMQPGPDLPADQCERFPGRHPSPRSSTVRLLVVPSVVRSFSPTVRMEGTLDPVERHPRREGGTSRHETARG